MVVPRDCVDGGANVALLLVLSVLLLSLLFSPLFFIAFICPDAFSVMVPPTMDAFSPLAAWLAMMPQAAPSLHTRIPNCFSSPSPGVQDRFSYGCY